MDVDHNGLTPCKFELKDELGRNGKFSWTSAIIKRSVYTDTATSFQGF